jgi:hypothetical protein
MDIISGTNIDNLILGAAALITGVGTIIVCLNKTIKTIYSNIIKENKQAILELEKNVLKLILYNDAIDIDERIRAGENYILKGGNGSAKIYFDKLSDEYKNRIKV